MLKRRLSALLGVSLLVTSFVTVYWPARTAADSISHSYNWTKITAQGTDGYSQSNKVKTDSNGNVYVMGTFSGPTTFDGSGGNHSATTESSIYDMYLTKYDANGTYQWTKTINLNSNGYVTPISMAIDYLDDIYLTGFWIGTISFESFGSSDSLTAVSGKTDSFLTKINADGSYGWTRHTTMTAGSFTESENITTDNNADVTVVGEFRGTTNFNSNGSDIISSGTSGTKTDVFVTKYNSAGDYQWTAVTNSSGSAQPTSVVTNSNRDVIIAGDFNGTTTFDATDNIDTFASSGGSNGFYLILDKHGTYDKVVIPDQSAGVVSISDMAIDWSDNIYATGAFSGTVNFDTSGGTDNISQTSASFNPFLTKLSSDGSTYGWTKTFDDTNGVGIGEAVALDWRGNIYTAGLVAGTNVFDGVGGNDAQSATASAASYLTSYDYNGNYRYTQLVDGDNSTQVGVAGGGLATYQDTLYLAGSFIGTATFDGQGGSDSQASSGNGASFVSSWRLGPRLASTNNRVVKITSPTNGHTVTGGDVHVTGTSFGGAQLSVKIDGHDAGTATADSGGNWALTITGQSLGSHTIEAQYQTSYPVAYMSDFSNNNIRIVSIVDKKSLGSIDLNDDNARAQSLAVSPSGKIVVTTSGSDCYIGLVDPNAGTVNKLVTNADYPDATSVCSFRGIAFSSDGNTAYVVLSQSDGVVQTGDIVTVNLGTGAHSDKNIGFECSDPYSINLNGNVFSGPKDEFWVTCDHDISIYNSSDLTFKHEITTIDGGEFFNNIAFANGKAYVSDQVNSEVRIFSNDGNYDELTPFSHGSGNGYTNVVYGPAHDYIYVLDRFSDQGSQVTLINGSDDTWYKDIPTNQPPESIAISPDSFGAVVVGDDHGSGEIYFGNEAGEPTLTDGIAFPGGSFYTLNSDFLYFSNSVFSDSVNFTLSDSSVGSGSGSSGGHNTTTNPSKPQARTDTSKNDSTEPVKDQGSNPIVMPSGAASGASNTKTGMSIDARLVLWSLPGLVILFLILLLFRRSKKTDK